MRTKRTRTDFLLFPKIIREALPHLLRGRLFNCRLSRQANRALVQGEEGQYTDANPWELLAQLHNHKAEEHRRLAAEYAKTALERDVNCTHGYSELVAAMGGRCADWCASNHYRLIQWLEGFLADHMDSWSGIMWLLDQLLDGQRFEEARAWCDQLSQVDHTFRTPLYRGLICWYEGDRERAMEIWEQMQREFSDSWQVWFSMGDIMARSSRRAEGPHTLCGGLLHRVAVYCAGEAGGRIRCRSGPAAVPAT